MDHKVFPQKLTLPYMLLLVLSKWAWILQPSLNANKNIFWSSIFSFVQLHYRVGFKKKKKWKPTEEQNTNPGKTVSSHISSDHQGRKEPGPSLSRPSSSPDSHLMFFCYFNFTTSKWGENRLIVSMSLDCDQRHTKQFQNLQQPQLGGEDGDGFTVLWIPELGESGQHCDARVRCKQYSFLHSFCTYSSWVSFYSR